MYESMGNNTYFYMSIRPHCVNEIFYIMANDIVKIMKLNCLVRGCLVYG